MSEDDFLLSDLFRADFRTSREGDELNSTMQTALGLDYRYQVARIAIATSLGDASQPRPVADMSGKPIRGETLFGIEEIDLAFWTALIVQHLGEPANRKAILDQAAAHWVRGARSLHQRWTRFDGGAGEFLVELARPQGGDGLRRKAAVNKD
jgi:hypothetical protein